MLQKGMYDDESHDHCYHKLRGVIHMVIPDGHIIQKCCKCEEIRVIHIDHMHEVDRRYKWKNQIYVGRHKTRSWFTGAIV